jgi:KUP system potassium uptake protein
VPKDDRQNIRGTSKYPLRVLALAALGIVFGDIGTSPLYAIKECFHGDYGIPVVQENILGVLSLVFWALIIIVSVKYLVFVLQADNNGEGGVLALTALIGLTAVNRKRLHAILVMTGIFGGCLLYGDGIITPAISVLSAVQGLSFIAPGLHSYIMPATIVILAVLFFFQHKGTGKVGMLFGPVMVVWFVLLAVLGVNQIIQYPGVLIALLPTYAVNFVAHSGMHGFLVLGAVFLVATGAEALYADLGHFGRKPIRLAWFGLVLPALVINYFGQGAILLSHPGMAHQPFYSTVPGWGLIPVTIFATCATIIASQAVITGIFSLTHQAIQLGFLPRMRVVHTSARQYGQIYLPQVNWIMMVGTLGLLIGFKTSDHMAAAYGMAVISTMVITNLLFYALARTKWHWGRLRAGALVAFFFIVDIAFFAANLSKIPHGGWFPLVVGFILLGIMMIWKKGVGSLAVQIQKSTIPYETLETMLAMNKIQRIKGYAVFLTGHTDSVPVAVMHNLQHNKILHSHVMFLHFNFTEVPRVPNTEKLKIADLGEGVYRIDADFGFMEHPDVRTILSLIKEQGVEFPLDEISFFIGRERLAWNKGPIFKRWRAYLFAYLSRNSYDASLFFNIPQEKLIEIGAQHEI